jgi:hypothetical protein
VGGKVVQGLCVRLGDDWRAAAGDIGAHVQGLDLIRAAFRADGLDRADKRELVALYSNLGGYRSPLDLPAAEIADRFRPLLANEIESEIATIDTWPVRRGPSPASTSARLLAPGRNSTRPQCRSHAPPRDALAPCRPRVIAATAIDVRPIDDARPSAAFVPERPRPIGLVNGGPKAPPLLDDSCQSARQGFTASGRPPRKPARFGRARRPLTGLFVELGVLSRAFEQLE